MFYLIFDIWDGGFDIWDGGFDIWDDVFIVILGIVQIAEDG